MDSENIIKEIIKLKSSKRRGALATVIESRGSTPAKAGAKMLVLEGGSMIGSVMGSVGGGCLEAEVYQVAQRVIREGNPEILQFSLTDGIMEKEGHMCGGTLRVFIESI